MRFCAQAGVLKRAQHPIKDKYLVALKDGSNPDLVAPDFERAYHVKGGRRWKLAINGFEFTGSESAAKMISESPLVDYVQEDGLDSFGGTLQTSAPWGLDRIDQHLLPLDNGYTYQSTAGNVTAYVIDSGIRASHVDFGGRVVRQVSFVTGDPSTGDCTTVGHGTGVASILGGATYGVAKAVSLVNVRVLGCSNYGGTGDIVNGINWVIADHVSGPAVVNYSIESSGPINSMIETAIRNALYDNLTFVVIASNFSVDACTLTAARMGNPANIQNNPNFYSTITVAATEPDDRFASFSGYGPCVDILAPGDDLKAASNAGDTVVNYPLWGTSFAAPHVSGVVARYLAMNSLLTSDQIEAGIKNNATTTAPIANLPPNTTNRLLYIFQRSR